MGVRFTDTHCHLDQLAVPEAAISEAAKVGVKRLVAVSEDLKSMQSVLRLKELYPEQVLAGLGVHPVFVVQSSSSELDIALALLAERLKEAAVLGEVGLDFKFARSDEQQLRLRKVLETQFELAAGLHKPVNLHSRWALRQTLEMAIDYTRNTGLGAQMHWFTQSRKLVRKANEAGVYVSVGPSLLFSDEARKVAGYIDRSLLLLETDAPVSFGGKPSCPSWVYQVAQVVAKLWNMDLEEVSDITEANFARFLGK